MKRFVGLCLSLLFSLSATMLQAQSAKTPLEFNDQLSLITDSLYTYGQKWGQQFNNVTKAHTSDANSSTTYSSLKPHRQSMSLFLDRSIGRLKTMEDVNNSKKLRMAMITFLEYEKKMITEAFMPIEQLKASSSSADLQAVYNTLKKYSDAESAELQKVVLAQDAYAASNGFSIGEVKEGEKP